MDENELEELDKALKQINRCLDERFEENADLYIAPEQVEDIKNLIYAGNYDRLAKECSPALKKFSPQVMAYVLIKNAWLMRSPRYATLKPIFEECGYNDLKIIMEKSVLDNKIAMPSDFRFFLIKIYLNNTPSENCRQMLEQNPTFLNNVTLRALCLRQILKDVVDITARYKIFYKEVKSTPALLTQGKILSEMFQHDKFNDDFMESVFDDNLVDESTCTQFWIDTFGAESIPDIMSNFKSYCRRHSSNQRKCSEVLGRVFRIGKKDFAVFANLFADACNCMDGFANKKSLASKCLNLTKDETEGTILKNALKNIGLDFDDMEKGTLADIDEIKEALCEDHITDGKYKYLVASFHNKYRRNYKQKLDEIRRDINEDVFGDPETAYEHFEKFCCCLVERTELNLQQNLKYIIYVIDNLVAPYADRDDNIVKHLLNHIERHNIFATCQGINGIAEIKNFVHDKDFDLFCKLME